MSRTWTAATPVRVTEPGRPDRYLSLGDARAELPGRTVDVWLRSGNAMRRGPVTYQLIPEAVAMADDLPLENGR